MRTRICPLCDQPMKKAHYCDSCNSFVWKSVYIDIHYNTSGSSGQDCAYDAVQHDYSYHEDGSVTTMPVPERKPVLKRHPKTEKWEAPEFREIYGGEETGRKKSSGKGRLAIVLAIALVLFSSLPEIITGIVHSLRDEFEDDVVMTEVYETEVDFSDDGYAEMTEFTDEEVIARGEECTGHGHLDIVWEDFRPLMEESMTDFGIDITDYSDDSDNYAYFYGSEDSRTYYTRSRMYHLNNDTVGYFNISWDTVSERLHEVSYHVSDREKATAFFEAVMGALTGDDKAFRDQFEEEMAVAAEEGYVFYYTDVYEVYISYDSEVSYYISITKVM